MALFGGLLGAAVNVALNFYLIPRYGHLGTSLSTAIAEISICILLAADLRRNGYDLKLAQSFVKPGLALIPSILFMLALYEWNFIIIALVGLMIYTIALLLLRFLEPDEMAALAAARKRLQLTLVGK